MTGTHVSSTACSSARALLAEGIANLKRRKKCDPIRSKSDTSFIAHTPGRGVVSTATNPGPPSPGPIKALDKILTRPLKPKKKTSKSLKRAAPISLLGNTKPTPPGAIYIKPKASNNNSQKKGLIKNSPKVHSK
ncbi:hypothetical protein Ancab_032461 [Ancistrocladus abbreviatus]